MITINETVAAKIASTLLGNYEIMDNMYSPHTDEWASVKGDEYEESVFTKMILDILEAHNETKEDPNPKK